MPEEVNNFHRVEKIPKVLLFQGGDLFWTEPVFQRRREKKIFVGSVYLGQRKKEIPEIYSDSSFFPQEGSDIKSDAHLEVMYVHKKEKSREPSGAEISKPKKLKNFRSESTWKEGSTDRQIRIG